MHQKPLEPRTHHVTVAEATACLGYEDMLTLAGMFERWALTSENISPDDRTGLMLRSADYERIADFVGPGWEPPETAQVDAMLFVARLEQASE